MKNHTKIISLMLSLIMALSVFTAVPFTAGAVDVASAATGETSGTTGDCTWSLDGTVLTISGSGAMEDYYWDNVLPWGTDITEVIIEDGVTNIGDSAFYDCTSLTSVTIGNSVTSIGDFAFNDCYSLTSVTIPDSVTWIGYRAFYVCTRLSSITVSPENTVYDSRGNCNAIIETESNTLILGCKNTVIPDTVTSIGEDAFSNCESLTNITIPNSVTSIDGYAFCNCSSLTSITIGNSVTSIGDDAFSGCYRLTSVIIPDSVTSIGGGAFYGTAWYDNQPDGLVYAGKVAYKMKGDCPAEVSIKDGTLGIAGEAFYGCESLTSITIPDSVISIGKFAFGWCKSLESIIIPDSVTSIGWNAFEGCTSLTSITIPDTVTSIGYKAFCRCSSLASITIPDSVTSIGYGAFAYCTSLTSVTIPDSVTSIGKFAFSHCTSLTNITIPNSVTSINVSLFAACESLASIIIPDSVISIGSEAFYGCTRLTSITIPDSVTSIGSAAFFRCESLASITIPDSVTSIGSSAFSGCTSLTSVTIPDSVASIGRYAFYCCYSLTSVTIPDSVTSIGDRAFGYYYDDNRNLAKVDGFTIYGHTGSEAERYANDNEFTFVAIVEAEEHTATDADTGISVVVKGDFELKAEDITNKATADEAVPDAALPTGEKVAAVYDITLTKDGETVQPIDEVTVQIPCDNEDAKVYRVEEDDSLTDMQAEYEIGCLIFTTDHFSVYIVAVPQTGATVKGSITSYLDNSDVTVKLSGGDFTAEVKGKADYSIADVPAGEYTLTVAKANHVTREYEITIGEEDLTEDVEINPIGDVNGDGEITQADSLAAIRQVRLIKDITDKYQLKCADINGDGEITQTDALAILRHVRLIKSLY